MDDFLDMARVTFFGSRNNASRGGGAPDFDPARDISPLTGKVVLITGGAEPGGLGHATAVQLARYGRPARIYIADLPRSEDAQRTTVQGIVKEAYGEDASATSQTGEPPLTEVRFLELDLGSFESVRKCAAEFVAQEKQLDILFLNAGLIKVPGMKTVEGYEIHFGVNYLGHALLSRLLTPILVRTAEQQPEADVRVVVLSSEGHVMAPKNGVDLEQVKTECTHMNYSKRYGQSKVAQIGLMKQLAKDYPQIKTVAIHPGRIITGFSASLQKDSLLARLTMPIAPWFCVPVSVGIRNHLWAATSPDVVTGTYYEPVGVVGTMSAAASDEGFPERLRKWTDEALSGIEMLE